MVAFGSRELGDGRPCFLTFEAGATHDGLDSARRLAGLAAQAGADAVKFQLLDPDRLVADRQQIFTYEVLTDRESGASETVAEPLYDILCRRAMSADEWRVLKAHCDRLGLAFFATVGFAEEVALLEELACDSVKIASADVNHVPLLRRVARTGMCVQLDTGNATVGEIEAAVDTIRGEGNDNILIHHCPSGYPARLDSINLNVIPTLKRMFPYPIGYSDHSPGWEMDIAAAALGANLIEKTITEDRTTRSVEHIMSIEPPSLVRFVRSIRDLELALGGARRILSPEETLRRAAIRRSIHVRHAVDAGQRLRAEDLDYRRPGDGISPASADQVIGRTMRAAKRGGARLTWSDLAD